MLKARQRHSGSKEWRRTEVEGSAGAVARRVSSMHDNRTAERDALAIVVESVGRALESLPLESAWQRSFLEAKAVADAALAAIRPGAAA
jgi:hypothetical protein